MPAPDADRQSAALNRLMRTRQGLAQALNAAPTHTDPLGTLAIEQAQGVIRRHPWASVLAGLAVGAIVAHQHKRLLSLGMASALPWLGGLLTEQAWPLLTQWSQTLGGAPANTSPGSVEPHDRSPVPGR